MVEPIKGTRTGVNYGMPWWVDHPDRKKPKGRICRHRGCDTILSVYNRQEYCSIHANSDWQPFASRFRAK
jgi:hypothetical protein